MSIDELGPVDWIVVEFPGTKLTGEIAPVIEDRGISYPTRSATAARSDDLANWRSRYPQGRRNSRLGEPAAGSAVRGEARCARRRTSATASR
ncbi:MAG TPA: hypothetical protein VKU77_05750 [Streptosporangiaceae bacterium]|nr:hypothetical protein [Streptosporangiaceae bacterium]